jgi:hypothetical protein
MPSFGYIFPFLFMGMWIFVYYLMSRKGWDRLVEKFRANDSFHGTRVGVVSATINQSNYNGSLVLKYNYEGIWLRPVFIFRLFHPAVLIPWTEIKEVRDRKMFFVKLKELVIGNPFVAIITLKESVYNKLEIPFNVPWKDKSTNPG